MSTIEKVGVVLLNLVGAVILIASLVDPALRVSGLVFVAAVIIIWERTRE